MVVFLGNAISHLFLSHNWDPIFIHGLWLEPIFFIKKIELTYRHNSPHAPNPNHLNDDVSFTSESRIRNRKWETYICCWESWIFLWLNLQYRTVSSHLQYVFWTLISKWRCSVVWGASKHFSLSQEYNVGFHDKLPDFVPLTSIKNTFSGIMKYILFRCVFSVFIVYNCVYLWWSIHLWSQFVCLIIDCVISFIPFCRRCWIIYPRRWVHLWGLLTFSEWKSGKELQGKTSTFLDTLLFLS